MRSDFPFDAVYLPEPPEGEPKRRTPRVSRGQQAFLAALRTRGLADARNRLTPKGLAALGPLLK